jgi:8-oxo-dGTP pyrophosphatase MutT (NUDIX family)
LTVKNESSLRPHDASAVRIHEDSSGVLRNSAKAIIIRDGRLLAIRNIGPDGDWYILPGGGQRFGETLGEALKRECLEEAGASVSVGRLRLVREYIGKNHEFSDHDGEAHQVEFMFECEIVGDYAPRDGHLPDQHQTGVDWLPIGELERHRLYPKVLSGILKQGFTSSTPVYLGDVN